MGIGLGGVAGLSLLALGLFLWLSFRSGVDDLKKQSLEGGRAVDSISPPLSVLHSAPVGFGQVSNRVFGWTNKRMQTMVGYSAEELLNHRSRKLYSNEKEFLRVERVLDEQIRRLGTGTLETEWRHQNGSTIRVLLSASPLESQGATSEFVFTAMDISDRKEAERISIRSQKMVSLALLIGGIAHDFNNLLSIVIGNLGLLKTNLGSDEDRNAWTKSAYEAASRGAELTRELLTFSSHAQDNPEPTDLNELIRGMKNIISSSLTPSITVTHNLARNLWRTFIDPGEFNDAFLNLVINARDAMPQGGRLIINTRNQDVGESNPWINPEYPLDDFVVLEIEDNGKGMPQEHIERAFDPFFTTKEKAQGTGLGLSMVFGFVQKAGGYIDLQSKVGSGTILRLFFPRSSKEPEIQEKSGSGAISPQGGGETILLVDDEADLLSTTKRILEILGYATLPAQSGKEALEILNRGDHVDLLFTDVVMPGKMSGYDLAEQALKGRPDLQVLFTSGFTQEIPSPLGGLPKNLTILPKPYRSSALARAVRKALEYNKEESEQ